MKYIRKSLCTNISLYFSNPFKGGNVALSGNEGN